MQDLHDEKYLSDNRDRYMAQSAATKHGKAATLPPRVLTPLKPVKESK